MILPWMLLFSLLTIHADNYKPKPVKVWIQPKQQREFNPDLNSKLLGPKNEGPSGVLEETLPNHANGIEPREQFSAKSLDEKLKPPTKEVSLLTMFKAFVKRIKKQSARVQIKFHTKGNSLSQAWYILQMILYPNSTFLRMLVIT